MRAWKIAGSALQGLRRTPLRLALTVLGVSIGSGALATMVGFSIGLQRFIETPFQALGLLDKAKIQRIAYLGRVGKRAKALAQPPQVHLGILSTFAGQDV